MTTTYNSWTNYETWAVALWIDNEQGSYQEARSMARQARDKYSLADSLKEWIGECAPEIEATLYSDLLNAALSEVDWTEIAEHYADEVGDTDSDETDNID